MLHLLQSPSLAGLHGVPDRRLAQFGHRMFQQVDRLWYGTGADDIKITPMWLYPGFAILEYFWYSSWNRDMFLPALAFLSGIAVTAVSGFRKPAGYLMIVFITVCALMEALVPLKQSRYVYHMIPLLCLPALPASWCRPTPGGVREDRGTDRVSFRRPLRCAARSGV